MPARQRVIVAVDPGHRKCGLAAVSRDGGVVHRAVVAPEELPAAVAELTALHEVEAVVVGNGTQSQSVCNTLSPVADSDRVKVRDEVGTSLLGRARYWLENPPRGLWRLVPTTLRMPPEPFDDWVAVILAEREWVLRPAVPPEEGTTTWTPDDPPA